MKRGLPKLQRAVVRAARKEVRRTKALWKQYKRLRRSIWSRDRWSLTWGAAPLFLMMVYMNQRPEHAMAVLALYCTGTVFMRNAALHTSLYHSYELAFFLHVPASDREFFSFQLKRAAFSSLFVFILCLAVYTRAAYLPTEEMHWSAVITVSLLQWLLLLMSGLLLAVFRRKSIMPGMLLYLLGLISLMFPTTAIIAQQISELTPSGWIHALFKRMLAGNLLFPAVALITALGGAVAWLFLRLRSSFPQQELVLPVHQNDDVNAEDAAGDPRHAAVANALTYEQTETLTPAGVSGEWQRRREGFQILRAQELLHQPEVFDVPPWRKGPLEHLASLWFSPREKILVHFLCGGSQPAWTSMWKAAAIAAGISALFSFMAAPEWLIAVPLILSAMLGAPLFGGSWAGFRTIPAITQETPLLSAYPVGYFEVSRVIVKANILRILAWAPLFAFGSAAFGMSLGIGGGAIVAYTLSSLWIVVALQLCWVSGKFSAGTNDTKRLTFTTMLLLMTGLSAGIPIVGAAVFLFHPDAVIRATAAVVIAGASIALWAVYGYFYQRRPIDTVRPIGS